MFGLKEDTDKPQESPRIEYSKFNVPESKVCGYPACFSPLKDQGGSGCRGKLSKDSTSVGYVDSCDDVQEEEDARKIGESDGSKRRLNRKRMTGCKHTLFFYSSDDDYNDDDDDQYEENVDGGSADKDGNDEFDDYFDDNSGYCNEFDDVPDDGGLDFKQYKGLSKKGLEINRMPDFIGQHIRFIYSSDDEIDGEE